MLTIVVGKPGTGKSYHVVAGLVDFFCDCARYEKANAGKEFERVVFSNLHLDVDALNDLVVRRTGIRDADVSHYYRFLDPAFFVTPDWWKTFPEGSHVVVDEVHKYLTAATYVEGVRGFSVVDLVDWLSTHRHQRQDITLITQHTDNFERAILTIADTLWEVVNIKNKSLPFPLSIPIADLDVVRGAWGLSTQFYQVNVGTYRGRSVRWTGTTTRHVQLSDVYAVYTSHTMTSQSNDRPDLKLGRIGSIIWFLRKHIFHLIIKGTVAYLACYIVYEAICGKDSLFFAPVSVTEASVSSDSSLPSPTPSPAALPVTSPTAAPIRSAAPVTPPVGSEVVTGYFPLSVITSTGRVVRIGDTLIVDGEPRRLIRVDVKLAKAITVRLPGSSNVGPVSPAPPVAAPIVPPVSSSRPPVAAPITPPVAPSRPKVPAPITPKESQS
ncbi:MAG: zonular occludens toxin domain-containing protein [Thermoguttaceae bacterium]